MATQVNTIPYQRSGETAASAQPQLQRALEDVAGQIREREEIEQELREYIANPPTPPDFIEAGIEVDGDDISFARQLPLIRRALPRVRPGMAQRAEQTRRELGNRVVRAADNPRLTRLHQMLVLALATTGILLILWGSGPGIVKALAGMFSGSSQPEAVAPHLPPPPPPPTATTPPPPTPTPEHGGLAAPQGLTIPAAGSGAGGSWTILPVLEEQWRTLSATDKALFPLAGGELRQMGAYPGEADNLILFGVWQGFGDTLENLQLNDWLVVTDRNGVGYLYIIVPCDQALQRKECIADKRDLTQLGHTSAPTLTLVASRDEATNYIIRAVGGSKVSH